MNETVNQETKEPEERTFTQAELNEIVSDRLKREREKYADYEELKAKASKYDESEEKSKSELEKMTEKASKLQNELDALKKAESVRGIREKVAEATGVPASLLTSDTEEGCTQQAESILSFAKPGAYPQVPDGGEVQGNAQTSTRQQFAEWFNNQS